MNKLALAFFMILGAVPARAQFFSPNPTIVVLPHVVTAQVYNPYYEPIACQGYAFGRSYWGQVAQSWFADIIPPGAYRFATVTANPYNNRFVSGWAQINCRFLRY
jgi:hypothetical protein